MDWIDVVQDGDKWWAVGKTLMNFSGGIERQDFLDQVRLCQLLNKDCALWN
jgi:hypothetical protein